MNKFNDYQEFTKSVNLKPTLGHVFSGLVEEVGELAGHIKRLERDDKHIDDAAFIKELGDILWYVSELASVRGYSLDEVVQINYKKLKDRVERNVLRGSGDER